jgi:hypothetical protein
MTTRTPDRSRRSRLLIPRRDRWPRKRSDWLPLGLVIVLVAAVGGGGLWRGSWLVDRLQCRDGFPTDDLWSQDGECVGISPGDYAFGKTEFTDVMAKIDGQNTEASGSCGPNSMVTVGVLTTWTADGVGGRAVHELEGIAAAQYRNNHLAPCLHSIKLRVAQVGRDEQAAEAVADRFGADPDVVAVVGMGLSNDRSATAIRKLGESKTPMVADLITAEGFDSRLHEESTFADCKYKYKGGLGGRYLHRVAYSNDAQVARLAEVSPRGPDLVVTPISPDDPYTCTLLSSIRKPSVDWKSPPTTSSPTTFDPTDQATIEPVKERICRGQKEGPVTVFYAARARDLSALIATLDSDIQESGDCAKHEVTILSSSDAARLRAVEPDNYQEHQREVALGSGSFRVGKIKLIYTPLADRDSLAGSDQYKELADKVTEEHLDDGWAISGHDALTAVGNALRKVTTKSTDPVTRSVLQSVLDGPDVQSGIGGPITFRDGNLAGERKPVAVRLCPSAQNPTKPTTVVVNPGVDVACP